MSLEVNWEGKREEGKKDEELSTSFDSLPLSEQLLLVQFPVLWSFAFNFISLAGLTIPLPLAIHLAILVASCGFLPLLRVTLNKRAGVRIPMRFSHLPGI